MPVIVLIRRCVRPDRVDKFLESYNAQKPDHPDFIAEYLTEMHEPSDLPEALKSFELGVEGAKIYINVAFWRSSQSFAKHFNPKTMHEGEIETADRVRAVLDVMQAAGHLPDMWSKLIT